MDKKTTEFIIYIINEIAAKFKKYPSDIYRVLDCTGCIRDYLTPCYDVLHTMSTDSIINDVIEFVEKRGAAI